MRLLAPARSLVALLGPFHGVKQPDWASRQDVNIYKIYKCIETTGKPRFRPVSPPVATVKGMYAAKAEGWRLSETDRGTGYAVINPTGYSMVVCYTKPKTDPATFIQATLKPLVPAGTTGTDFTSKRAQLEREFPSVQGFKFVLDDVQCFAVQGKCIIDDLANDAIPTGAESLVFAMAKEVEGRVNDAMRASPKLARAVKAWCRYDPTNKALRQRRHKTSGIASMQVFLRDDLTLKVVVCEVG